MRRRRTQALAVLVVVVLAGGGYGIWAVNRSSSATPARTVDYTVASQTVQQTVSASGTLSAASQANLSFSVSGQINAVNVTVGQSVTAGQVLATVNSVALSAQNQAAQAQVTAAKSAYSADAASGASSAQLASDSAQIQSASASATQAAQNLSDSHLTSTISGTVAAVNIAVGDQAGSSGSSGSSGVGASGGNGGSSSASSSSSSSSSAQIVVITPGTFVVNTSVSGSDIASVKTGMQAQLTVTGSSTKIFGTVTSVGLVASSSSSGSAATFPVTISVTGTQANLYAGTSVTASIIVKQVDNVLAVPALALNSTNGQTTVEKVVNGSPVKTVVAIGETYGAQTQITSGLSSGDTIQMSLNFNRTGGTGGSGTGTRRTGTGGTGGFGGLPGGFGGAPGGFSGGAP